MPIIEKIPRNEKGRDFVVGDIHGCFTLLFEALEAVGFDPTVDRLFITGDLVDRGPECLEAFDILKEPWCFSVVGNHEQIALDWLGKAHEVMPWAEGTTLEQQAQFRRQLEALPLVLEIETPTGNVGIVHAEVPDNLDWSTFIQQLEAGNRRVTRDATWSCHKIESGDNKPISGIARVYVGHCTVPEPLVMGNVVAIDTGAVYGLQYNNGYYLTLAYLNTEPLHLDPEFDVRATNQLFRIIGKPENQQ